MLNYSFTPICPYDGIRQYLEEVNILVYSKEREYEGLEKGKFHLYLDVEHNLRTSNCDRFIEHIFYYYRETKEEIYLEAYKKFCKIINDIKDKDTNGIEEIFVNCFYKYMFLMPEEYIFGNYNLEGKTLFQDIKEEIKINGNAYSIEEFVELSKKVKEINKYLLNYLQYADITEH